MKKFLILFLLCFILFSSYSDGSSDISKLNKYEIEGFNIFLKDYINYNISVYLSKIDLTINGKLITVYKDGIIVETFFKQTIFIKSDSISFVEIFGVKK